MFARRISQNGLVSATLRLNWRSSAASISAPVRGQRVVANESGSSSCTRRGLYANVSLTYLREMGPAFVGIVIQSTCWQTFADRSLTVSVTTSPAAETETIVESFNDSRIYWLVPAASRRRHDRPGTIVALNDATALPRSLAFDNKFIPRSSSGSRICCLTHGRTIGNCNART